MDEFERNPEDGGYLNVINHPGKGTVRCDFFLPKLFFGAHRSSFQSAKLLVPSTSVPLSQRSLLQTQENGTEYQGSY